MGSSISQLVLHSERPAVPVLDEYSVIPSALVNTGPCSVTLTLTTDGNTVTVNSELAVDREAPVFMLEHEVARATTIPSTAILIAVRINAVPVSGV